MQKQISSDLIEVLKRYDKDTEESDQAIFGALGMLFIQSMAKCFFWTNFSRDTKGIKSFTKFHCTSIAPRVIKEIERRCIEKGTWN